MANIITQLTVFDYMQIEVLGDLERLHLCLAGIDDQKLVDELYKQRKNGRNDYPIEVMLNLTYAYKIFSHRTIDSFRRELSRNSQLRAACGLHDHNPKKKHLVPPARVFTKFFQQLVKNQEILDEIFEELVDHMYKNIDGFGKTLAGDGKIIQSYSNNKKKVVTDDDIKDNRSETDAEYTKKTYYYTDSSGKEKEKTKTYFGFRAHIICDVETELPIAMTVTKANRDEKKEMTEIIKNMAEDRRDTMKYMLLDKGYDSTNMHKTIMNCNCKPIIDKRDMWQDGEKTKQYKNTDIVYDQRGNVFFVDYENGKVAEKAMSYKGYDKDRDALRYEYKGKTYRIQCNEDRRIFTQVARSSKKYKRLYKGRTAVERFNGRLDRDYMFEDHCTRGLKKMNLFVKLSGIIMLAMAKGHITKNQTNYASLYVI